MNFDARKEIGKQVTEDSKMWGIQREKILEERERYRSEGSDKGREKLYDGIKTHSLVEEELLLGQVIGGEKAT